MSRRWFNAGHRRIRFARPLYVTRVEVRRITADGTPVFVRRRVIAAWRITDL